MKFQDKFYDVIDHNKYPSSEKSAEKCILMNSYFHHSEPNYTTHQHTLMSPFNSISQISATEQELFYD